MSNDDNIDFTGRDDFITGQALVYAIAHIQNLPREKQERSNMLDMCELARSLFEPANLARIVDGVENHIEGYADVFEEDDGWDAGYKREFDEARKEIRDSRSAAIRDVVADVEQRYGIKSDAQTVPSGVTIH